MVASRNVAHQNSFQGQPPAQERLIPPEDENELRELTPSEAEEQKELEDRILDQSDPPPTEVLDRRPVPYITRAEMLARNRRRMRLHHDELVKQET